MYASWKLNTYLLILQLIVGTFAYLFTFDLSLAFGVVVMMTCYGYVSALVFHWLFPENSFSVVCMSVLIPFLGWAYGVFYRHFPLIATTECLFLVLCLFGNSLIIASINNTKDERFWKIVLASLPLGIGFLLGGLMLLPRLRARSATI